MKNLDDAAKTAGQAPKVRATDAQQIGLRFGIVRRARADRTIDLETPEGQVVRRATPIYPSELMDWPAPSARSVVVWGCADGNIGQPFYLGVVRPADWTPKQDGSVKITGDSVNLNTVNSARVNGMAIMVIGGQDSDGDIMSNSGQPPQITT